MSSNKIPSVLLVDDDEAFRTRLGRAFEERHSRVLHADSVEAAEKYLPEAQPEWAVIDLRMSGESGLTLVSRLKELSPATRALVLTGYGSIPSAIEAVKRGAVDFLTKPVAFEKILAALQGGEKVKLNPESTPKLSQVERNHIDRVMTDCEGNVSKAAKLLGLHRRSLQRKLNKRPN